MSVPLRIWSSECYRHILCAGNVGAGHAIFEQGASAGNVGNEKILDQKKANPVALLLSSAMMLRHLQFPSFADRLETAVKRVISGGKYRTKDLGGDSSTQEVVDAVIAALEWSERDELTVIALLKNLLMWSKDLFLASPHFFTYFLSIELVGMHFPPQNHRIIRVLFDLMKEIILVQPCFSLRGENSLSSELHILMKWKEQNASDKKFMIGHFSSFCIDLAE